MFYREFQQDQKTDFVNPDLPDTELLDDDICPYMGTECPYRQDQDEDENHEFNADEVRQRPRPRPYNYPRPYYHRPYYPRPYYHRPYYPVPYFYSYYYQPYNLPFIPFDYYEDYD